MASWTKIKADPIKLQKHNENSKNYAKNKYETNPEYREYMREKARQRKAMLREAKKEKLI